MALVNVAVSLRLLRQALSSSVMQDSNMPIPRRKQFVRPKRYKTLNWVPATKYPRLVRLAWLSKAGVERSLFHLYDRCGSTTFVVARVPKRQWTKGSHFRIKLVCSKCREGFYFPL